MFPRPDDHSWGKQSFDPYHRASSQWGTRMGSTFWRILNYLDLAIYLGSFAIALMVGIRFLPLFFYTWKGLFDSAVLGKPVVSNPASPKGRCGDYYLSPERARHYVVLVSGISLEEAQAICGNALSSLETPEIHMAVFDSYNEAMEFASAIRLRFEFVRIDEKEVDSSF